MPAPKRPSMTAARRREVLVEAGHRCAIPTCKQIPVEVHHIDGDRTNHAFENLIALCRNCHKRADKGEIDRKALGIYKANLGVISGRYGDMERRLLSEFAKHPERSAIELDAPMSFQLLYLVEDGIIESRADPTSVMIGGGGTIPTTYALTEKGRELVQRLSRAQPIE